MSICESEIRKAFDDLTKAFDLIMSAKKSALKENWKEEDQKKIASAEINIRDAFDAVALLF